MNTLYKSDTCKRGHGSNVGRTLKNRLSAVAVAGVEWKINGMGSRQTAKLGVLGFL